LQREFLDTIRASLRSSVFGKLESSSAIGWPWRFPGAARPAPVTEDRAFPTRPPRVHPVAMSLREQKVRRLEHVLRKQRLEQSSSLRRSCGAGPLACPRDGCSHAASRRSCPPSRRLRSAQARRLRWRHQAFADRPPTDTSPLGRPNGFRWTRSRRASMSPARCR
jgi:hypothetical protein